MKKTVRLFLLFAVCHSLMFHSSVKAQSSNRFSSLSDEELSRQINQTIRQVEQATRKYRDVLGKIAGEPTIDTGYRGYLLLRKHYPETSAEAEKRLRLKFQAVGGDLRFIASAAEEKESAYGLAKKGFMIVWEILTFVDGAHEAYLRNDISRQHPEWTNEQIEAAVILASEEEQNYLGHTLGGPGGPNPLVELYTFIEQLVESEKRRDLRKELFGEDGGGQSPKPAPFAPRQWARGGGGPGGCGPAEFGIGVNNQTFSDKGKESEIGETVTVTVNPC